MIDVCFWCNRAKTEGNGKPEYTNYEFCESCMKQVMKGVCVIQVTESDNGNPAIQDNLYPTGKWVVVSVDNFIQVFEKHPTLSRVLDTKRAYINEEDWVTLQLP